MSKKTKLLILILFLVAFIGTFWYMATITLENNDPVEMQMQMMHQKDSVRQGLPELKD